MAQVRIFLTNSVTHRQAFTGPQGQPGYGADPGPALDGEASTHWIQPDGVETWFYQFVAPENGNVVALTTWVYNPDRLPPLNNGAYMGPDGEDGSPGAQGSLFEFAWTMPDGRKAWYQFGHPTVQANLLALLVWPYARYTTTTTPTPTPAKTNTSRPPMRQLQRTDELGGRGGQRASGHARSYQRSARRSTNRNTHL